MEELTQEQKEAALAAMAGGKKEEVKEEKKEEVKEDVKEEKKEEVKEETKFSGVEWLNQTFGKEFKAEDDIKSLFETVGKYEELQKSYEETNQSLSEYKSLAEKIDPMAHFLDENEYKRQQFLIQNKGKLGEAALQVLSALSPSRIKDLGVREVLRTDLMINQELTSDEADAVLAKKYEVEDWDSEEMDKATVGLLKIDANEAKKRLSSLYKDINIPEKTNFEEARQQLKESWNKPLDELVKGIDKLSLAEGLDVSVTDSMKEGLVEETMSDLLSKGIKPSEATLQQIAGSVRTKILERNMDSVIKSITNDLSEKIKAEVRAEVHNDKPLNNGSRGEGVTVDNDATIKSLL